MPPITGHNGQIWGQGFSSDGGTLIRASKDGQVILWDISVDSWLSLACQRANRNLTQVEWRRFFSNEPYRLTYPDLPPGPTD